MKNYKKIILAVAIILLAAACNKVQPQSANQPITQSVNQQNGQATTSAQTPKLPTGSLPPQPNPAGQPIDQHQEDSNFINVSQAINGVPDKGDVGVPEGMNAMALLQMTHKVETKDYGAGLGEFVESIDGAKPDSKHYWEFYVNGKSSNVGASSYVLKAGDKIEWKLSAINSSGE